jgi:membrane protein YdbS with pleckstrin-like domain
MFAPRDADRYLLASERRVIRERRHWAILLVDVLETVGLLVAGVLISFVLPLGWAIAQSIVWYLALLVIVRFAYKALEWWEEIILVSDRRFMIVSGVFTHRVTMMPISKVTDLTYERTALGRLLGYGSLVVESAGQVQGLDRIDFLPKPERIYDEISQLIFGDPEGARFSMMRANQQVARRGRRAP